MEDLVIDRTLLVLSYNFDRKHLNIPVNIDFREYCYLMLDDYKEAQTIADWGI